jgi:hypothetical protein
MGTDGFTSPPKEVVLRIFITLKNPWSGSNPRTLGPVASTLTTSPPRSTISCTIHPEMRLYNWTTLTRNEQNSTRLCNVSSTLHVKKKSPPLSFKFKTAIFCSVTPCSLVLTYKHFKSTWCFNYLGRSGNVDERSRCLWNVCTFLPHYTASGFCNLHHVCHENLKSHSYKFSSIFKGQGAQEQFFLNAWCLTMKELWSFEMSWTTNPLTQHHNMQHLSPLMWPVCYVHSPVNTVVLAIINPTNLKFYDDCDHWNDGETHV